MEQSTGRNDLPYVRPTNRQTILSIHSQRWSNFGTEYSKNKNYTSTAAKHYFFSLQTLDQEIKYEGMKYLSTSLRYNTVIIDSCFILLTSIQFISFFLQTLEQFYFKFNIIGVEGVRYITVLLSFNIGNNYISKTSLEFLKTVRMISYT